MIQYFFLSYSPWLAKMNSNCIPVANILLGGKATRFNIIFRRITFTHSSHHQQESSKTQLSLYLTDLLFRLSSTKSTLAKMSYPIIIFRSPLSKRQPICVRSLLTHRGLDISADVRKFSLTLYLWFS